MALHTWLKELPVAITVCDADGIILEMNDRSIEQFAKDGGAALIGKSLIDCHPEPARSKLIELLKSGKSNCYTIEKNGVHKMIYQSPWFDDGIYKGFVEISFEIPQPLPHFIRG